MSYTPALGSKGVHAIFSTWGLKMNNNIRDGGILGF